MQTPGVKNRRRWNFPVDRGA